jgi:hypothetical protein
MTDGEVILAAMIQGLLFYIMTPTQRKVVLDEIRKLEEIRNE